MIGARQIKPNAARSPGTSAGLDVAEIVRAARSIAPDQLSMQAVANELGVDRKALNNHVQDRATLLGMVAAAEFAEQLPELDLPSMAGWEDTCRAYAQNFSRAALRIGLFIQHIRPEKTLTTRNLASTDALFAKLTEAGFTDEVAVRGVALLTNICYAHARDVAQRAAGDTATRAGLLASDLAERPAGSFPNLERISARGIDTYGDAQLAFSLETWLGGMTAMLASPNAAG